MDDVGIESFQKYIKQSTLKTERSSTERNQARYSMFEKAKLNGHSQLEEEKDMKSFK